MSFLLLVQLFDIKDPSPRPPPPPPHMVAGMWTADKWAESASGVMLVILWPDD